MRRLGFLKRMEARVCALSLLLGGALMLSGCGQNLNNAFLKALNPGMPAQSNTGGGGGVAKPDPWKDVDLNGTGSIPLMGSNKLFQIDTVLNTLTFSIPLPVNPFGGTGTFPIPEIPGATLSIGMNSSGSNSIDFTIPLSYLAKGMNFSEPSRLPNGQPLPGVPGGELPRVGVHIAQSSYQVHVYGSVKYFALYVPVPRYTLPIGFTIPIKNKAKNKVLGYFASVPVYGNYDGGYFISLVFPAELSKALDTIFN